MANIELIFHKAVFSSIDTYGPGFPQIPRMVLQYYSPPYLCSISQGNSLKWILEEKHDISLLV